MQALIWLKTLKTKAWLIPMTCPPEAKVWDQTHIVTCLGKVFMIEQNICSYDSYVFFSYQFLSVWSIEALAGLFVFIWSFVLCFRNYHVVRDIGPQDLQVVFLDTGGKDDLPKREVLKGEVVGIDPFTDTAVVKVFSSAKRLVPMRPLPIGESATLEVGPCCQRSHFILCLRILAVRLYLQVIFAFLQDRVCMQLEIPLDLTTAWPFLEIKIIKVCWKLKRGLASVSLNDPRSKGIISGKSRTLDIGARQNILCNKFSSLALKGWLSPQVLRPIQGCIQTDASINPGVVHLCKSTLPTLWQTHRRGSQDDRQNFSERKFWWPSSWCCRACHWCEYRSLAAQKKMTWNFQKLKWHNTIKAVPRMVSRLKTH